MVETLLFKFILSPRGNFDVLMQSNDVVVRNILTDHRVAIAAELRDLASRCEDQIWPFPSPDEPEDERIREGGQFGMGA